MILYIYELQNFDESIINNLPENICVQDQDESQICFRINIEDFKSEFIIRLKSNLLFIIANKKSQKRKIFKQLYSIFNKKLSYFNPNPQEEHNFLCSFENSSLKFIHNNKIVSSSDLKKKYCNETLDDDFYFFEANIKSNTYDSFLYYGDAIKIKDNCSVNLYEILGFFERKWLVK